MNKTPVIAIFDVGKTNKKLFLFDEQYKIVFEEQANLSEVYDEDGDSCEDLDKLIAWINESLVSILNNPLFQIQAINFSSYGASFVHLDNSGKPLTPLYSYLKKYPEELLDEFYASYGGKAAFSLQTASPVLGSLNSGMQLYRIKKRNPKIFQKIKYSLHLPQFLNYLVSNKYYSELTSIGCHTNLWNFAQNNYHEWVFKEGLFDKLAPIIPSNHSDVLPEGNEIMHIGVGLHDSSAALIPYMESFLDPFILISTGTWCINLNPFNDKPLTHAELQKDCLCYLSYKSTPVKASRIFAGYQHEKEVKRISSYFQTAGNYYTQVVYDPKIMNSLSKKITYEGLHRVEGESLFHERELSIFENYEEAYHQLIADIIRDQASSLQLVLEGTNVKRFFVDGGFGKNPIYMHLLAKSFDKAEVFAASIPQATALGAALAIHNSWNKKSLPDDIIELRFYTHPR